MESKSLNHQDNQYQSVTMLENVAEEMADQIREGEYLETVRKLRLDLADKSDLCEFLKIKLDESERNVSDLSQELDECKMTILESKECSKKIHEEVLKSKKIEEDYVKLMSAFLDLGEQTVQQKQTLVDNFVTKSNLINNIECLMSSGAINKELEDCRLDLDERLVELNLVQTKIRHLEEENTIKKKSINELKKALDEAKVTHKHEINVLEEYIHCLKNTITSYEKTLTSYIDPKLKDGSSLDS